LLVLSTVLLSGYYLPLAHAVEPPTKILAVIYPSVVETGNRFPVKVQVAYSAKFGMIDVGIWDLANGTVVQSLVSNATLNGPGESTYNFVLKPPQNLVRWRLAAIVRAWFQNAWFYDQEGEFDFSVTVANHGLLVLGGLPSNSTIYIDGRSLAVNSTSIVVPLALGSPYSGGNTGNRKRTWSQARFRWLE